ncbi:urease subunit beta [Microbacterium timonense]|nr:urease subunit beta [Microbacterium timonense]
MVSRKPKYLHRDESIEINAGRPSVTLRVTNTGDRPVQVGSHFHFFEVNAAMRFEREKAWGMHMDIPAGTGVRFEPGETKEITLVAFAGARRVVGFNGLVNGSLDAAQTKTAALRRLAERGFQDGEPAAGAPAATPTSDTPTPSDTPAGSDTQKGSN